MNPFDDFRKRLKNQLAIEEKIDPEAELREQASDLVKTLTVEGIERLSVRFQCAWNVSQKTEGYEDRNAWGVTVWELRLVSGFDAFMLGYRGMIDRFLIESAVRQIRYGRLILIDMPKVLTQWEQGAAYKVASDNDGERKSWNGIHREEQKIWGHWHDAVKPTVFVKGVDKADADLNPYPVFAKDYMRGGIMISQRNFTNPVDAETCADEWNDRFRRGPWCKFHYVGETE